ncbi:MAG: DNA mismatch repair endonuclease MutL [Candidatus Saganbacteria bacterium]|nr:DNA mismatch repair endonuclease MutL [Candidatus Saganbacteria bacterium]
MSQSINILPEDLINKIAAGEVIERPASVVKELIENAIDAKASRIKVEIQQAGRKLIRVSDNGAGMSKADLQLAVERHATSKLSDLNDLFNIKSLGFRGEALPSIASVSIMELISRESSSSSGTELRLEGGKRIDLEDFGSPTGTSVTVKDLFFNTPARKKFLKSPATEMGHIGDIVAKYALARPEIAFELVSDGKPLLSSPGSGKLADAVIAIYGIDLLKNLIESEQTFKNIKVAGLISRPTLTRLDRSYETFFVNGRYVKNFLLNKALEQAYRTLIPNNRFPAAVIFLEIDPKHIDVNVHPTKKEIKFSRTQEVMDAVREFGRTALSKVVEAPLPPATEDSWTPPAEGRWQAAMADALFPEGLSTEEIKHFEADRSLPIQPVYQHNNTYIICKDGPDLVLIDQHAAHERVLYDQLSEKSGEPGSQPLLSPETLEFTATEFSTLQENIAYLQELGFDAEEFGNNSFRIRSFPSTLSNRPAKELLLDIAVELQQLGKSAQLEAKQENIRKLIACHSAIKAGDKLSFAEMHQLIAQLLKTENPLTCPHGRPTMIRLTLAEFEKRFKRSG